MLGCYSHLAAVMQRLLAKSRQASNFFPTHTREVRCLASIPFASLIEVADHLFLACPYKRWLRSSRPSQSLESVCFGSSHIVERRSINTDPYREVTCLADIPLASSTYDANHLHLQCLPKHEFGIARPVESLESACVGISYIFEHRTSFPPIPGKSNV